MRVFNKTTSHTGWQPSLQLSHYNHHNHYNHYKRVLGGLLMLGVCGMSHAATYQIDPTHANVRFAIDHFGTSTNTGGFYNLTGTVDYDPRAKEGSVMVTIQMTSLNTGNSKFDTTLKSSDFFDVDKYPTATFVSTQWHFGEQKSKIKAFIEDDTNDVQPKQLAVTHIDGTLTLKGQTHPITLTATKFNCYFSPILKTSVCGGDFTTTIDRTKWSINKYVLLGMAKDVTLNIQIEAAKK